MHALAGLYAIDALETEAERRRFERHLQRCRSCSDEVRGLRETATRLGFAAARRPPPTLRPRVMSAVATASQLPVVRHHARPRPRTLPLLPRLSTLAAGAAVAVALVLGAALAVAQHRLDQVRTSDQAIAAVLAAPDAQVLTSSTSAGGTTTLVVSAARRQMIVTAAGLPAPPSGKVYQLWLIGPPQTRSAGLLPAGQSARPLPVLASGLATGDEFGMTVEPVGGTAQPTTTPIVVIKLPG